MKSIVIIASILFVIIFIGIAHKTESDTHGALNAFIGTDVEVIWSENTDRHLVEYVKDNKKCSVVVYGSARQQMFYKIPPICN